MQMWGEKPFVEGSMVVWQIAASAVSGAAALGMGSMVGRRLLRYRNPKTGQDAGDSVQTSLDRFRPMARLLNPEDLRFLASRPGYRPEMGARLRDSRRRIFRMYLAEISSEFQRLHAAARRMAAEAPEQHADLVPLLLRQQVVFWRSLAVIEVRLALSWAGLAPADASALLEIVEQLQRALAAGALVQAPGGAGA